MGNFAHLRTMALEKSNAKNDGKVLGYQTITKVKEVEEDRCNEVQQYLSTVLGENLNGDLFEELKDGILLCRLLNTIKADTCKKFKASKIAFVQRNNIKIYLDGCKKLGMTDLSLFESEDLFESKRLTSVLDNIYAVSAFSRKFDFKGPFIGVKLHESNKRNFTKEQLAEANKKLLADNIGVKKET